MFPAIACSDLGDCSRGVLCLKCKKCIRPVDDGKNYAIWFFSHSWEWERRRLFELPPILHEIMWVDLGHGPVRCQVLKVDISDYPDCCLICVPPYLEKPPPGQKRRYLDHMPNKYVWRVVSETMPKKWALYIVDLLQLQGGIPEVGGQFFVEFWGRGALLILHYFYVAIALRQDAPQAPSSSSFNPNHPPYPLNLPSPPLNSPQLPSPLF